MKNIHIHIILTLLLIGVTIIFFGISDIDVIVQDYFFSATQHHWVLDAHAQPYRFLFYNGLKGGLILIALGFVSALFFACKKGWYCQYKEGMLIVVLAAILVPAGVSFLKNTTNMPSPKNVLRYGGAYPQTKVWEKYPAEIKAMGRLRSWPAGHASAGFALLSLYFLCKDPKNKKRAVVVALVVGWVMGLYKMVIGDHFLSHTIITMLLAWFIILCIVKAVDLLKLMEDNE